MNHDEKIKALERVQAVLHGYASPLDSETIYEARKNIDALLADAKANVPNTTGWRRVPCGYERTYYGHCLEARQSITGWVFYLDGGYNGRHPLNKTLAAAKAACDKAAHEIVFGKGKP